MRTVKTVRSGLQPKQPNEQPRPIHRSAAHKATECTKLCTSLQLLKRPLPGPQRLDVEEVDARGAGPVRAVDDGLAATGRAQDHPVQTHERCEAPTHTNPDGNPTHSVYDEGRVRGGGGVEHGSPGGLLLLGNELRDENNIMCRSSSNLLFGCLAAGGRESTPLRSAVSVVGPACWPRSVLQRLCVERGGGGGGGATSDVCVLFVRNCEFNRR